MTEIACVNHVRAGMDYGVSGAPGEIRTPGLLVRSQALYPTELRAQRPKRPEWPEPLPFRAANITTSNADHHFDVAEREGFEPSMGF
jgi:hypothetical protein